MPVTVQPTLSYNQSFRGISKLTCSRLCRRTIEETCLTMKKLIIGLNRSKNASSTLGLPSLGMRGERQAASLLRLAMILVGEKRCSPEGTVST